MESKTVSLFTSNSKQSRQYKGGFNFDQQKRDRGNQKSKIRKKKRNERALKKRMYSQNKSTIIHDKQYEFDDDISAEQLKQGLAQAVEDIKNFHVSNRKKQYEAVVLIRRLLSLKRDPPIKTVLKMGVVPYIVKLLDSDDDEQSQFEASWCITNIASGDEEDAQHLIDAEAVPVLVKSLKSKNLDVQEQCVWALGNLAGDCAKIRDAVLQENAMDSLIGICLSDQTTRPLLQNTVWAMSNLCRSKPQPPWRLVKKALPTLAGLLNFNDMGVVSDACWALSYLSDDTDEGKQIACVIGLDVIEPLIKLLDHKKPSLKTPALRTIGNIVTGTDEQTDKVLQYHTIWPKFIKLLQSPHKTIRKEACWAISNITAGNPDQISHVIENDIFRELVQVIHTATEFEVRQEAAWAIANGTTGGKAYQVLQIAQAGAVGAVVSLFGEEVDRLVTVALDALINLLSAGNTWAKNQSPEVVNPVVDELDRVGGFRALEKLQESNNMEIYETASNILFTFCEVSVVDEDLEEPDIEDNAFTFDADEQFDEQDNNNNGDLWNDNNNNNNNNNDLWNNDQNNQDDNNNNNDFGNNQNNFQ